MASEVYMQSRKKYQRPQALLFSDDPGRLVTDTGTGESFYVPAGVEFGSALNSIDSVTTYLGDEFIILSDDNRGEISFSTERIEKRERMVNGRMRSYHVADKLRISTSYEMLPSRAYSESPDFSTSGAVTSNAIKYTTDGGAGGVELLDWYENHTGSFYVYLAYDKYTNLISVGSPFDNFKRYNQVVEVFFSEFEYSVVKRGGSNHDFWNVSFTLEEA